MNDITVAQTVLFSDLVARPVVVAFDQPDASSDGGAILLPAAERAVGVIGAMAAVMDDTRTTRRVRHSVHDLLAQRIYGLACGHADANDADALADDPIHKLLLDRDPIHGTRLASQPTLSRFENAVSPRMLLRLVRALE